MGNRSLGSGLSALPAPALVEATPEVVPSAETVNRRLWQRDNVARYAHRELRPGEVVVLARFSAALAGRVLEIGCGAGRILGYLTELGGEVHGIDIAESMLDYCRDAYPTAHLARGDLRALHAAVEGPFDAIVASDNILDVVEPDQRALALAAIRSLLGPDGLLIFSSHNLAHVGRASDGAAPGPGAPGILSRLAHASPARVAEVVRRLPRRLRNRRRLAPLQRRAGDHAILNDVEGDYGALHYYVRRDDQERQLAAAGFTLVECRDGDGRVVPAGDDGAAPSLHYIARSA